MEVLVPILKLAGGVGLFLFAMYLIEESLKNLSGRQFKLFLQRITKNSIGAVAGGAIVTGVLQSSSMVSLIVLAFVGAGVFTMKNALAIILGANLGTTLDSWVVALIGFKMNVEVLAYPAVFVGGLMLILFGKRKTVKYLSMFLLGFGLLFIGLSFMKTAMEAQVQTFDFKAYAHMSLAVFLLIGFVITLLVQSSSVTMALTLSALHSGAIEFPAATAIVLGSETGTTIKILLSAIGGNAAKKRVVLGNFIFNIVLTVLAFACLKPMLNLITNVFDIKDPLIGLVTFSSLVNLLSVLIFLPFLQPFVHFLERFFKATDTAFAAFIGHATTSEPETALDLYKRDVEYFMHNCMLLNLEQFDLDTSIMEAHDVFKTLNDSRRFMSKTKDDKYAFLRQFQGELQSFYLELRAKLEDEENVQLNQLVSVARSAMYAVKSIADITGDISNLSHSSIDIKYQFFVQKKEETKVLYAHLYSILQQEEPVTFDALQLLFNQITSSYSMALSSFYKEAQQSPIEDIDMTIALNFNRELFTANKAMLMAIKDFSLNETEASRFNELTTYKT
ncbi:MAG: Na/Pi cotransporter family protein [Chitinophagales bacterium]|nr:Na/Pi cotransporter family protein [Chitinophagales bacterium]